MGRLASPRSDVAYMVLVQMPDAAPMTDLRRWAGARGDVEIIPLASKGLSRSRNAALDLVRTPLMLIADDDVTHPPSAFDEIIGFFARHPAQSVMTGQSFEPGGRARKRYGARARALSVWSSASVSSHEIALRVADVRARGVRFDEAYGLGAGTEMTMGEEYIFVADCLRAGLRGQYRPVPVSVHPAESSGFDWKGAARARARAAIFARVFGWRAPAVRLAFALKNRRKFAQRADIWAFLKG